MTEEFKRQCELIEANCKNMSAVVDSIVASVNNTVKKNSEIPERLKLKFEWKPAVAVMES